jgi:hypothetical protein
MNGTDYLVVLIDPQGHAAADVRYRARTREEAEAWAGAWDEEPLGLVAVVWPGWAPLPDAWVAETSAAALSPAKEQAETD